MSNILIIMKKKSGIYSFATENICFLKDGLIKYIKYDPFIVKF